MLTFRLRDHNQCETIQPFSAIYITTPESFRPDLGSHNPSSVIPTHEIFEDQQYISPPPIDTTLYIRSR